ncbi:hypothetical protein [Priestia aryabhattai]
MTNTVRESFRGLTLKSESPMYLKKIRESKEAELFQDLTAEQRKELERTIKESIIIEQSKQVVNAIENIMEEPSEEKENTVRSFLMYVSKTMWNREALEGTLLLKTIREHIREKNMSSGELNKFFDSSLKLLNKLYSDNPPEQLEYFFKGIEVSEGFIKR